MMVRSYVGLGARSGMILYQITAQSDGMRRQYLAKPVYICLYLTSRGEDHSTDYSLVACWSSMSDLDAMVW